MNIVIKRENFFKLYIFFLVLDFFSFFLSRRFNIGSFGGGVFYNILMLSLIGFYLINIRRIVFQKILVPLFILFAFFTFSGLWAYDSFYFLRDISRYSIIIFSVLFFSALQKNEIKEVLTFIFRVINYIAFINLIIIIFLIINMGITNFLSMPEEVRFGNSLVFFGVYLMHVIWHFLNKSRNRFIFLAIDGLVVYLSFTRVYIIAFSVAFLLFYFVKRNNIKYFAISILVLFLFALLLLNTNNPIKRRFFWKPEQITFFKVLKQPSILIDEKEVVFSGRLNAWRFLVEASRNYSEGTSFLGSGIGSSRPLLMKYQNYETMHVPHGDYTKYLAETGYIGLALYIIFLLYYMVYALAKSIKMKQNLYISRLYFGIFCCFIYFFIVSFPYEQFNKIGFTVMLFLLLQFAKKSEKGDF